MTPQEATETAAAWVAALPPDPPLGRVAHSGLHRFCESYARAGGIVITKAPLSPCVARDLAALYAARERAAPFIIEHDWRAALPGASDTEGEVPLPCPHPYFEMLVAGRHTITVLSIDDTSGALCTVSVAEVGEFWVPVGVWPWLAAGTQWHPSDILGRYLHAQVRAALIAMDADVAEHEIVRAPAALNKKRARAGRPPLRDYHVINLARRYRIGNPSRGERGPGVRLHFVRGHWRHFDGHKSWVKWHLRGDPDLGYIHKEYRL